MKNFEKNKKLCRETVQIASGSKSEELGPECMSDSYTCGIVYGETGYPKKCVCGSPVKIFTSKSIANPGRPYFRCAYSRADGHLFKWVEDGTYEEVNELKDEGMFLINDLKLQIKNLKEEVQGCKTEMKKIKRMTIMLFSGLCIVAVVVFCDKMFDQGESSLVFGKKTM
ncbi:hypothetical protein DY000_02029111 [Brassica cretica]|uniref:GRF-type domain-containing protein n=1 Tax=Brassica cretica TaxID=69181 RepID=A0ABQ7DY77_BRACR|nr:hypothetical protein DY000_02029111 [Brassica cretica]